MLMRSADAGDAPQPADPLARALAAARKPERR
jgi:hypothetical protein